MMRFTIRQAERADAETLYTLVNEQAPYRDVTEPMSADIEKITESLFRPGSDTHALLCEFEQTLVGYAVVSSSYSPWPFRVGLNLEVIYSSPDYHDLGAGKAMLQYIAREAIQRNCERIEWNVLNWDGPANDFYLSIDALPLREWVRYRLGGEALKKFAEADHY